MGDSQPVKCQSCGKPIGYITVSTKSYLVSKPAVDNVKLAATCMEYSNRNSFLSRNS